MMFLIFLNSKFYKKNYKILISPFFGGGSFEFYLQNKYDYNVLANDKFTPLISFWKTAKNNNEDLCNTIKEIRLSFTKEKFMSFRNSIMNIDENIQAAYYFAIVL